MPAKVKKRTMNLIWKLMSGRTDSHFSQISQPTQIRNQPSQIRYHLTQIARVSGRSGARGQPPPPDCWEYQGRTPELDREAFEGFEAFDFFYRGRTQVEE